VLACIGEQFDEGEEVCGVTVNIRNGKDRLELWSKTAANEALQMSIGKQLKQMLDIPDSNKIGFVVFVSVLLLLGLALLLCDLGCWLLLFLGRGVLSMLAARYACSRVQHDCSAQSLTGVCLQQYVGLPVADPPAVWCSCLLLLLLLLRPAPPCSLRS
jgi:hypothetical protein